MPSTTTKSRIAPPHRMSGAAAQGEDTPRSRTSWAERAAASRPAALAAEQFASSIAPQGNATGHRRPQDPPLGSARAALAVRLTNRWATFLCDPDTQVELKQFFRYQPPGYRFAESYRLGSWDGYVNLMARGRVGAGLFLERRAELAKHYRLRIDDQRVRPQATNVAWGDSVRPYQRNAVCAMIRASKTGGLVLAATGSGKTFLAAEYLRRLVGRACFVVDELSLLQQAREEIAGALRETVGIVGKSEFRPARVTVATIQTLHKHRDRNEFRKWFETLDVLIIDEIHLAINRRNADVIQRVKPLAVFGLTATLQIEKDHVRMPVMALAGPVVFEYSIRRGVREGYLSDGVVVRVSFPDPLRGLAPGYKSGGGQWIASGTPNAEYRRHVVLNRARNDLIEQLAREGVRRKRATIILVEHVAHLHLLSRRLADVRHARAYGAASMEERTAARAAMEDGSLPLIIANRVFSKGVNIRRVGLIIDATAQPGRNGVLQRYGRGARRAEGKDGLIYADVADEGNTFAGAAHARAQAYREIGCRVICVAGDARAALDRAEKELR